MTRKIWFLIVLAVLLAGLSFYLNKDWFGKDTIQITHRSRPPSPALRRRRAGGAEGDAINPLTFIFNHKVRMTSIKVIPMSDIETNKYPHPIWYLISESNSVPVKDFSYGIPISGMHPAVKEATPYPLEPDTKYRLLVELAGAIKVQHDFVTVPRAE